MGVKKTLNRIAWKGRALEYQQKVKELTNALDGAQKRIDELSDANPFYPQDTTQTDISLDTVNAELTELRKTIQTNENKIDRLEHELGECQLEKTRWTVAAALYLRQLTTLQRDYVDRLTQSEHRQVELESLVHEYRRKLANTKLG